MLKLIVTSIEIKRSNQALGRSKVYTALVVGFYSVVAFLIGTALGSLIGSKFEDK